MNDKLKKDLRRKFMPKRELDVIYCCMPTHIEELERYILKLQSETRERTIEKYGKICILCGRDLVKQIEELKKG